MCLNDRQLDELSEYLIRLIEVRMNSEIFVITYVSLKHININFWIYSPQQR